MTESVNLQNLGLDFAKHFNHTLKSHWCPSVIAADNGKEAETMNQVKDF